MSDDRTYPEPITEALQLRFEGKHGSAIRKLTRYIRQHSHDEKAHYELASTLFSQQQIEEALQVLTVLLEIAPQHIDGLRLVSEVLVRLNRPEAAQENIEEAMGIYDRLHPWQRDTSQAERLGKRLRRAYWGALRVNGRLEEALEIARRMAEQDEGATRDLQVSLIDVGNLAEAEVVTGTAPEGRAAAVWSIALQLGEQGKYDTALPYFLRILAYSTLPKNFKRLSAYIECLALAHQTEAAQSLNTYWLRSRELTSAHSLRRLQIMSAVIKDIAGDKRAAESQIQTLRTDWGQKDFVRHAKNGTTFYEIERIVDRLILSANQRDSGERSSENLERHSQLLDDRQAE